ncbi:hypothetical protein GCM10017044_23920 [Kordiimonas sediminis]|uniref:Sortilin N-terminal domain-containing protein n=1 Tax=Kordiimonas sediminis TaxID=1735581 RepID=A0A919E884_9PROT|nr:exo-alpha-sialidase [Kordiimonas sediminis]GHF27962.1 hypothetical protein GCM10017044_23920 [Kordiimonas sediminis]
MKNTFLKNTIVASLLLGTTALSAADSGLFEGMKGRSIGPATMSGRVAAIDTVKGNPNHIYVGSASGGVWESRDAGTTWAPIFDNEDVASIGAVAINQSNPDIIWVGTGEGNVRNSVSIGNGIYKSLDGGKTWQNMGLKDSEHINRIAIDPTNPDIVYVAAMGHLWSDGGERGIYKTTDGGKTWNLMLAGENDQSGATDIKIDPKNPNNLYASMWQFRRYPDYFESGGPGSGLHVSHDGGETWRELTQEDGLPEGDLGRSVFTIAPSDTNTVYALIEAKKSAIIRTDDGGRTWRKVNEDKGVANRPFYYMELLVDPNDKETVYNIATTLKRSDNGGRNFETIESVNCCSNPRGLHIDLHSLWINPENSNHLILGNDGGLGISHDRGETWRFVANLPVGQFYQVNVDNELPYNIYGGLQDNGSFRGPANVWENGGIRNFHWQEIGFGDGFDASPDPENAMEGYSMSQGGALNRWNLNTGESFSIRPNPDETGTELRFNWNSGFAQDPFDPATIYYGSQFLHKSTDRGRTWQQISGDLTTNNKELQRFKKSGGITADVTAAENWQTITAVAPSPIEKGTIWVGTDDGRVHVTRDGGETWNSIGDKVRGEAKGSWVPHIEPSPHDASQAFIVFDDHRRGNMDPHVYRIDNYGRKWTNLATKDVSGYALSIQQDHVDPDLLFLGTEFGLFVSRDAGKNWMKWTAGVPTVSVMDLAIQERENDLVLATHGRAIIVIDDYSGLRNLSDDDLSAPLKLLSVTDGIMYDPKQTPGTRFVANTAFIGDNEPYGAMITFVANGDTVPFADAEKEKARQVAIREEARKDEKSKGRKMDVKGEEGVVADKDTKEKSKTKPAKVKVEISDADGKVIRTYTRPVTKGINRITWRGEENGSSVSLTPRSADADLPGGFGAVPGTYTVKLTLGEETVSGPVTIKPDPRVSYSQEDFVERHAYLKEVSALRDKATQMVLDIRASQKDLKVIKGLADAAVKDAKDTEDDVTSMKDLSKLASDALKSLDNLEESFIPKDRSDGIHYNADKIMSRINGALYYAASHNGTPSDAAKRYRQEAEKAFEEVSAKVKKMYEEDIKAVKDAFAASDLGLLSQSPSS